MWRRYFGKGEFAFRKQALLDLEAQGMDFGENAASVIIMLQQTFGMASASYNVVCVPVWLTMRGLCVCVWGGGGG